MSYQQDSEYDAKSCYEIEFESESKKIIDFLEGKFENESLVIKHCNCYIDTDFFNALANNTILTELNLKRSFFDFPVLKEVEFLSTISSLVNALEKNTILRTLDLSNNYFDSVVIDYIVKILEKNTTLTKLNLGNNFFEENDIDKIVKALQYNDNLISVSIDGGVEGISDMLINNSVLTELKLKQSNKNIRTGGLGCRELIDNTRLMELRLSRKNKYFQGIGNALAINTTLTSLSLKSNDIGEAECRILAKALDNNTTLMSLNLSDNYLDRNSNVIIEEIIKKNTMLTSLNLNNCFDDIGFWWGSIIKALVTNTTLTEINLGNNNIYEDIMYDLDTTCEGEVIGEKTLDKDRPFVNLLENNSVLTSLNLSDNEFGEYYGNLFLDVISNKNSTLTHLNLERCSISKKLLKQINIKLSERQVELININVKPVVAPNIRC